MRLLKRLTVIFLAATFCSSAAFAQEAASQDGASDPWAGVEEMLVTGAGTAGLLQDVANANSVTAFSEEDLVATGASDISDLADYTPNLEIVTAGATSPTFYIRGIGLNDFNANAAGAVAIYVDDIPLNSPALQLGSLYDIQTVNVLRGPQGTQAFRNASAGAIKSYSRVPSGDFEGYLRAEFGNYDAMDFEGAVDIPIVQELLSTRFSFRASDRDGWMRNRCAGAPAIEDRPIRTGPREIDPAFSYCGETVLRNEPSDIDPFQPKYLNARHNWSVRMATLFTPILASAKWAR